MTDFLTGTTEVTNWWIAVMHLLVGFLFVAR